MAIDNPFREPLPGTTYNGFSGPGVSRPNYKVDVPRPPPRIYQSHEFRSTRTRPRRSHGWMVAGIAAALGVGLALGYFVEPGFQRGAGVPRPAATAPDGDMTAAAPTIEVAPPAPTAAPLSEPVAATPKPATHGRLAASTGPVRPAFHCDWARRPSERMVCGDAQLAQYDRQLNRAFTQAVRAGVPRAPLRAAQDRWVMRREQAARRSRDAVADLYRQRIAELTALAHGPS
jgi:uncharacterized protein YecT (DUF1311 family)